MTNHPRLRPVLADLPAYQPGRSAAAGAVKLSSNENPFPPLPSVLAALHEAAAVVNRYPDPTNARLVNALAERHGVSTAQVVLGTGSVAVADQLVRATADAGDEVVFAWRSFEAYPILTRSAGAVPVTVPLLADARHDLPAMAAAVTDRTRLVLVCTPNNPTGTAVRRSELERFLDAVPASVVVAVDEAYREYVRDEDVPDALTVAVGRPNVVVLRTFSKAFGLAGLRVGYAVAPEPIAVALRQVQLPFGVSTMAEVAAVASLAAESELTVRVDEVVAERGRLTRALRATGFDVADSHANFVWLRTGGQTASFAQACADAGVMVRPFPGEGVRVTVAEREANDRFLAVAAAFGG
ncbi:MAG TPA: histidinol-phosphate transaminase [Actinomycetes bacterium]|nr:histidinol-phosphate transaminase [Actinomycetes bacterium]